MFTSKKAQYLDNEFNKISPITNIDSLYYEQVEKLANSSYIITRQSVAKHMPINFNIENRAIQNINASASIKDVSYHDISAGRYIDYININIDYIKTNIGNPINPEKGESIFENPLYRIDSSKYVNIQNLLKYYTPIKQFDSSYNHILYAVNNVSTRVSIVNTSFNDVSNGYVAFNNNVYYGIYDPPSDNSIYTVIYNPVDGFNMPVKVQAFSYQLNNITLRDIISLDITTASEIGIHNVSLWDFKYDVIGNKLTYLKDEYGNEGNFDFANFLNIWGNSRLYYNNKFYYNSINDAILKFDSGQTSNVKTYENFYIYNSSHLHFGITSGKKSVNNSIINSQGIAIGGNSNKIINSSNNYKNTDCSIIIYGNNNTLINCNNCSINISGNNNILINLKNQNLQLGDNNVLIGDEIGCKANNKILSNDRLFLNQSSSTAIAYDLVTNCTVFGGIRNDVFVYTSGFRTTNK